MKKILLLFILNMPFGINAQISTNNTTNSGQHSSAIGISTLADDYATTAMGGGTKAYGIYSTAMGRGTEALGFYSTTMGRGTISTGYASLAIGIYNSSGSNYGVDSSSYYPSATAFVIGNGADENSRSDALVVKFNGDTTLAGSMTATSFIGEGSQITNLSFSNINNTPASFGNYPSFPGVQTETNQATGPRSFAAGHTNTSSGDYSTTFGSANLASGYSSTAFGATTTASGNYSTAMGYETTASGSSSTATGKGTIASGNYSTAMGNNTEAIGIISTTMGSRTIASDYSSLVVGEYNLAGSNPYDAVNIFNIDRPAFVIGNGTGLDSRSDALVVKFNGDANLAGSMTATSFIGDGSQLTNLPFSYNSNEAGGIEIADYTTASGSNAFAVGNDNLASGGSSTAMGRGTIAGGDDSTAMGANTEASGIASTAMGEETIASGNRSTAMGQNTIAGGYASTAMGYETEASGDYSTAMGYETEASGDYSTALGYYTTASGDYSTAFGSSTASGNSSFAVGNSTASGYGSIALLNANASGDESVAIGRTVMAEGKWSIAFGSGQAIASGDYSTSIGYTSNASGIMATAISRTTASGNNSTSMGYNTTASGDLSTATGLNTTASDFNSFVIGRYNLLGSTVTNSATQFSTENTAFVIGNGSSNMRSDALVVKFNGDATLAGNLNINSDARLKANIVSLGSTLSKLLQIDGKSYTMKKDESEKQKIGLLAQDIEKVFPELVSESNGIKSVNYQGLVPVLINALKEQDAMMKEQESKYLKQEKRLERLERLVAAMD